MLFLLFSFLLLILIFSFQWLSPSNLFSFFSCTHCRGKYLVLVVLSVIESFQMYYNRVFINRFFYIINFDVIRDFK